MLLSDRYSGLYLANTGIGCYELDFSAIKKVTLDRQDADVLYLLDSCQSTTAAIELGKELIAACTIEGVAEGVGYDSFTSALVKELNNAITAGWYLTAAQLWFKVLEHKHNGTLPYTRSTC